MAISPLAGKPAPASILVNIQDLIKAYYSNAPDVSNPLQLVSFGTSGHRGCAFNRNFNESHILAISQAICLYRQDQHIEGPLFLGMDTHALSLPALKTAVEVLVANGVIVMLSEGDEFVPTPAISHAILKHNQGLKNQFADGIIITPSHNPPSEGGFKYNPPNGGPADQSITNWIQAKANLLLKARLNEVKRIPYEKALQSPLIKRYNYIDTYVKDLRNVLDMEVIQRANIKMSVDPLGGASVHYWKRIAKEYSLNLTILSEKVDSTFSFMTVDWDGKIRMDPSSPYAMASLIQKKDGVDIAFACDTDSDRHGIVTKSSGLLQPNSYLSVAVYYLFQHRPNWQKLAAVGKTLVSSQLIDRVTKKMGRKLYEVPAGFKWFVDGLFDGSLGFAGEESAGASFARLDGTTWTTEKDGITLALLAAEITAKMGKDPGDIYKDLTSELGTPLFDRVDTHATPDEKQRLKNLSPTDIRSKMLAGEQIRSILTRAPGNDAPIGGVKVVTDNGWFAARPSGTEDIYKIYAESFLGKEHLDKIIKEAQAIVNEALIGVRT